MSRAVFLSAVAGVLVAVAVVELAVGARERRRAVARGAVAVRLLGRLGRRVGAPAPSDALAARLAAAGAAPATTPADLVAVKAGAALVGLALGVLLGPALPGHLPLVALLTGPALAFVAPDAALARRARRRGRAMQHELPDLLDLLRIAVEAGLAPSRALADVGRRDRGLLASEWRAAAARVELGVPYADALRTLEARCPAPGVPALVTALARADRHGTPLGETLAAQARTARATRAARVREEAARAAPKIQLVVALLLVPSVLLLVAAALSATLLGH